MRHIHIALVLLVCSFVTLSFAKSTLVYRRYHRKRPSIRIVQKNVEEIVEVFKTNRRPPAFLKSDKSIEKFLLCDAKCERKRFLKRRRMCLRAGRFCPTRPSGSKSQSTTQINVSTRPIYKKPTVYQQNPYGNRNPDYTHLYPWSTPSVTVTKYQPDRRKEFNMTIVEVNKDAVVTTNKYDYEYYDDNDDRHQHRRSTTFRVPTTTWEWTTPELATSTVPSTAVADIPSETSTPSTPTIIIPTTTSTLTEPPETTKPLSSTVATTTEFFLSTTTFRNEPIPVNLTESTTELISFPSPITIFDSTTSTTTETPTSTETPTTEITSTLREVPTEAPTTTSTTEILTTPTTTQLPTITTTKISVENETEATTTEQEEGNAEEYVEYEEGEEEEGEGAEEGTEDVGVEENGQVEGENGNYDYDDDGNYDDEDQTEDQA